MTTEELLDLVHAGYTKEEILNLDAAGDSEPASGDPQPEDPQPEDPQPGKGDPRPGNDDPQPDVVGLIAAAIEPLQQQIKTLTGMVQAQNRAKARTEPDPAITVETVVADFFGKPAKGGGD